MKKKSAIILAAGKGTRMKSNLCKVLHPVAGRPMIAYVTDAVLSAGIEKVVVVVGHQAGEVKASLRGTPVEFALQEPQQGTAHAVAATKDPFDGFDGNVLILAGDIPLIEPSTMDRMMEFHEQKGSQLTVLTSFFENPAGYGRIMRNEFGDVVRIVEERDASAEERAVKEINTGIYLADSRLIFRLLEHVGSNNAQGEYYLTDIIEEAVRERIPVQGFPAGSAHEVTGVNTLAELAQVSAIVWKRRREELMNRGVTMLDPASVYIDHRVEVGPDTVIHPSVTLSGATRIGRECLIEPGVLLKDCVVGDRVKILLGSRLDSSVIGDGTSVGPMAHLRPESEIGRNARVGNFVEVKKTRLGDGSKAAHLTYLGDSTIGKEVNIGCGTITCNYDGKHKHPTIIHDRCFIGSDVQFVAPVEIGEGSLIGAGSTITRDVPPGSLAVARGRQKNYPLRKGQIREKPDENRKP